mmetsp:Transcript_16584/g.39387  ORF Transcript_16584/g.39387 Transcript_16584/m.39387 type:complete len:644 (-) Transcript_16584:80-2011(-)
MGPVTGWVNQAPVAVGVRLVAHRHVAAVVDVVAVVAIVAVGAVVKVVVDVALCCWLHAVARIKLAALVGVQAAVVLLGGLPRLRAAGFAVEGAVVRAGNVPLCAAPGLLFRLPAVPVRKAGLAVEAAHWQWPRGQIRVDMALWVVRVLATARVVGAAEVLLGRRPRLPAFRPACSTVKERLGGAVVIRLLRDGRLGAAPVVLAAAKAALCRAPAAYCCVAVVLLSGTAQLLVVAAPDLLVEAPALLPVVNACQAVVHLWPVAAIAPGLTAVSSLVHVPGRERVVEAGLAVVLQVELRAELVWTSTSCGLAAALPLLDIPHVYVAVQTVAAGEARLHLRRQVLAAQGLELAAPLSLGLVPDFSNFHACPRLVQAGLLDGGNEFQLAKLLVRIHVGAAQDVQRVPGQGGRGLKRPQLLQAEVSVAIPVGHCEGSRCVGIEHGLQAKVQLRLRKAIAVLVPLVDALGEALWQLRTARSELSCAHKAVAVVVRILPHRISIDLGGLVRLRPEAGGPSATAAVVKGRVMDQALDICVGTAERIEEEVSIKPCQNRCQGGGQKANAPAAHAAPDLRPRLYLLDGPRATGHRHVPFYLVEPSLTRPNVGPDLLSVAVVVEAHFSALAIEAILAATFRGDRPVDIPWIQRP